MLTISIEHTIFNMATTTASQKNTPTNVQAHIEERTMRVICFISRASLFLDISSQKRQITRKINASRGLPEKNRLKSLPAANYNRKCNFVGGKWQSCLGKERGGAGDQWL